MNTPLIIIIIYIIIGFNVSSAVVVGTRAHIEEFGQQCLWIFRVPVWPLTLMFLLTLALCKYVYGIQGRPL